MSSRELEWDSRFADMDKEGLPLSGSVLTPPEPGKWRKHAALVDGAIQGIQPLAREIEDFVRAATSLR